MVRVREILLSVVTAVLLALSFPKLSQGWLSYVALVPLLYVVAQPRRSFILGWLAGAVFYAALLWWVLFLQADEASAPLLATGVVVLVLYLGLYFGLFALILALARRWLGSKAYVFSPFIWVSLEYVRDATSLGFPWGTLAYSQTGYHSLIQMASLGGVGLISGWIVLINTLCFFLIRSRRLPRRSLALLALLILSVVLPGVWGSRQIPGERIRTIRVALLQVNLDPDRVADRDYPGEVMEVVEEMVVRASGEEPDLVVLPESGLPGFLGRRHEYESFLRQLSGATGIPIVTGAVRHQREDQTDRFYNSALLVESSGRMDYYDKLHPVPFSERLPYDDVIPWIQRLQMGQGFYSPGNRFQVFDLDAASFSVLICFESIFPRLARRFTESGAQFLVNITNDSWFGDSPGPYQHAEMAVLRAVENRVPVARCANTGVSMLIDPYGRVSNRTRMFVRELVIGDIPLVSDASTPYRRWGEWFSIISLAISSLLLGGTCVVLKSRS